jgi:YOP proteins translocation protein K (YscK)
VFAADIDQCVYDFNCRPLGYVDPSWLDERTRPVVARLGDSGDAQARALASSWLLRRLVFCEDKPAGSGRVGAQDGAQDRAQQDARPHFDFDFTEAAKRILLLDPPALNDVALLLGLSSLAHSLRKCVLRSQQLQLRELLGEPLFVFFTEQVLAREPVARLVLDAQRRARLLSDDSLLPTCARFGATLLLLSCDAPGSPSLERARLKFARAIGSVQRSRPLPEPRRDAVVEFSIDCVIRERHPAWHWLF